MPFLRAEGVAVYGKTDSPETANNSGDTNKPLLFNSVAIGLKATEFGKKILRLVACLVIYYKQYFLTYVFFIYHFLTSLRYSNLLWSNSESPKTQFDLRRMNLFEMLNNINALNNYCLKLV